MRFFKSLLKNGKKRDYHRVYAVSVHESNYGDTSRVICLYGSKESARRKAKEMQELYGTLSTTYFVENWAVREE